MKNSNSLSAEVRWFFDGEIPNNVKSWFNASQLKNESKERLDTYLIYPNAKSCGVKFRGKKFEIKSLAKELGGRDFEGKAEGVIEVWEKWSTKGGSISAFKKEVTKGKAIWLDVKKQRIIRKFSADTGSIEEVDASKKENYPNNGCNVELTRIEIHKKSCWSLAFSAFGEQERLIDYLLETLRKLLSEEECPFTSSDESLEVSLSESRSQSYPGFLAKYQAKRKG